MITAGERHPLYCFQKLLATDNRFHTTMASAANTIISDFEQHIRDSGAEYYSEWYVGITEDLRKRLFGDHDVPEKNHWWITREAQSSEAARKVEKYFLEKGCDGGPGGGDDDAKYIYGYKKSQTTNP